MAGALPLSSKGYMTEGAMQKQRKSVQEKGEGIRLVPFPFFIRQWHKLKPFISPITEKESRGKQSSAALLAHFDTCYVRTYMLQEGILTNSRWPIVDG
jgi:hypothetical protein